MSKLSPPERQKVQTERRRDDQRQLTELRGWWIQRMVQSPRPLEEKMTLFWHGLFTSGHQTIRSSYAMYQQNELLRRHAVGNYGHLLAAIVRDPAMLRYLDNNSNVRGRPNENLAREILELFSMGEGNYTEADIKEAARALTGYGYERDAWTFRFAQRSHDGSDKTIFGQTGTWDGDKLVEMILAQPATARYIARKMFVFFVHDEPSEAAIDNLAQVLRESDYEVSPVLKVIFLSREFYSERALASHLKSPAELVVGTVKLLPVEKIDYPGLAQAMRNMGQDLFEPPNVKGWDGGRTWLNSNWLLARQNFAVTLVTGGAALGNNNRGKAARSRQLDLAAYCRDQGLFTPDQIVSHFSRTLLATPPDSADRAELLAALGNLPAQADWSARSADVNAQLCRLIVLFVSMPQYQLS